MSFLYIHADHAADLMHYWCSSPFNLHLKLHHHVTIKRDTLLSWCWMWLNTQLEACFTRLKVIYFLMPCANGWKPMAACRGPNVALKRSGLQSFVVGCYEEHMRSEVKGIKRPIEDTFIRTLMLFELQHEASKHSVLHMFPSFLLSSDFPPVLITSSRSRLLITAQPWLKQDAKAALFFPPR